MSASFEEARNETRLRGDPHEGAGPREVSSEELFHGARTVLIRHADAIYTLRRTANGKLILTK